MFKTALSTPCTATFPRTRNFQKKNHKNLSLPKFVRIIYVKSIQKLLHYPTKYFIEKMHTKNKTLTLPCAVTFPRTRTFYKKTSKFLPF